MTIIKAQSNTVVVTLFENTTIDPVRYLFSAYNKGTKVYSYCLVTEQSNHLERFNQFTITEKANPISANSEIELSVGDYSYYFYQLTPTQASAINFNAINTSTYTLVETMKLRVLKSTNTSDTQYVSSVTDTAYAG